MFEYKILTEKSNLSENLDFCNLKLIVWMFFFKEFKILEF